MNPGTKQLWQTRCDTSANDDIQKQTSDFIHSGPFQKQTFDGSQPTMMKIQKQTSDFIKGATMMKLQTQTSDFINKWSTLETNI